MKHSLFILLLPMLFTSIIHTKAILVRCPNRTYQIADIQDKDELKQYLFNPSCKTILIKADDPESAITLIRYAQELKKQNKTIICKVPEQVRTLLSWCPFVDQVVSDKCTDAYDIRITVEDLACLMQETIKNSAINDKPYIRVDETLRALWHEAFITDTNFKVGICCNPISHSLYKEKTAFTIESFLPLGCMQHISLYSFDDISSAEIPENMNLFHFNTQKKLLLPDLAAIIDQMDLVITTQPIIVCIATALGKNIWFITSENMNIDDMQSACSKVRMFTQFANSGEIIFEIMHELAYTVEKPTARIVTAEIATGELFDKMTILQIKTDRIHDQKKLDNICKELHSLQGTLDEFVTITPELETLIKELKAANEALWTTEDLIRDKEREKNFDNEFILLARSVYIQNDERCRVKREINELLGSRLVEEKSYKPYN